MTKQENILIDSESKLIWIRCQVVEPFKNRKILGLLGSRVHAGEYIQNIRQKFYMKPDGGTVANPRSISHWTLIPNELIAGNGFTNKEWELIVEIIQAHEEASINQMQRHLSNLAIVPPQIDPKEPKKSSSKDSKDSKDTDALNALKAPEVVSPLQKSGESQVYMDQIDSDTWCDVLGMLPPDIIKGSDAHHMLIYDNVTFDDIRKMRAKGVNI